jgi:hypothetical protein
MWHNFVSCCSAHSLGDSDEGEDGAPILQGTQEIPTTIGPKQLTCNTDIQIYICGESFFQIKSVWGRDFHLRPAWLGFKARSGQQVGVEALREHGAAWQ